MFHTLPMKTPGSNAGVQSIMTQVSRQKLWERVSMYFVFLENRPGLSEREVGIMQTWPVNADLIWGLSKEEINEELQKVRASIAQTKRNMANNEQLYQETEEAVIEFLNVMFWKAIATKQRELWLQYHHRVIQYTKLAATHTSTVFFNVLWPSPTASKSGKTQLSGTDGERYSLEKITMPPLREDDLLYSVLIRNFIRSVESDGEPPRKIAARVGTVEKGKGKGIIPPKKATGGISKSRDEEEAADSVSSDD